MEKDQNQNHQQEEVVLIVGAGPSGLAVAACLSQHSIPSLILERDDCIGPLWRKRSYERVCLHLAKQYCSLPHFPHSENTPTYIPKSDFISYLDNYVEKFGIRINFGRKVESARFESESNRWIVKARNQDRENSEVYFGKFLVVAAGENDEKIVPEINGISGFKGTVIHSSEYRNGSGFKGKEVLVVGSGNSGMEIAYDLYEAGAQTSIVVRSPLHIVTKEIWDFGMTLLKYLPMNVIDHIILFLCYLRFGNTAKYGLKRPEIGPFHMKSFTPVYPVVDVGTYDKIKSGEIQVLPSIKSVEGNMVAFSNGKTHYFDAIIFATGYRSTIRQWLEKDEDLISDDGMAKKTYPNHWKGSNGLYCAGLVRRGLYGSSEDGLLIADDINNEYRSSEKENGSK
ncbi:hypothetical protein LUZ60_009550 [Juncus effusus]|nr:hypothetical protein LUZ60_009550 [Juncus effusus]